MVIQTPFGVALGSWHTALLLSREPPTRILEEIGVFQTHPGQQNSVKNLTIPTTRLLCVTHQPLNTQLIVNI